MSLNKSAIPQISQPIPFCLLPTTHVIMKEYSIFHTLDLACTIHFWVNVIAYEICGLCVIVIKKCFGSGWPISFRFPKHDTEEPQLTTKLNININYIQHIFSFALNWTDSELTNWEIVIFVITHARRQRTRGFFFSDNDHVGFVHTILFHSLLWLVSLVCLHKFALWSNVNLNS